MWSEKVLPLKEVNLRTYTGENLKICGCIAVTVTYNGQTKKLPLLVVVRSKFEIGSRKSDWIGEGCTIFKLRLPSYKKFWTTIRLFSMTDLGVVKDANAKIQVDGAVQPQFCQPRPVPSALCAKVNG